MTEAIREVVEELQRRGEERWERAKRDGRVVSIPVEQDEATGSLLIAPHRATQLPPEPVVRFSSGRNQNRRAGTHDHEPLELTPSGLADRLKRSKRGRKGSAGYYAQTVFAPGRRTGADIIAAPSLATLDIDYGNVSIEDLMVELPPVGLIVHSTSSHRRVTDTNPNALTRWRVVIPIIDVKLTRDEHRLLIRGLERELYGALGVEEYDSCTERLTQLLYWPTDETVDDLRNFEYTDTLDQPAISVEQIRMVIDEQREHEVSQEGSPIPPKPFCRRRRGNPPQSSVISMFNEAVAIEDLLHRFGYRATSNPNRWTTPRSKGGDEVALLEGNDGVWRVHSHRASDRGTEYQMMSAFDLLRIYSCEGDQAKAIWAAARMLGLKERSTDERSTGAGFCWTYEGDLASASELSADALIAYLVLVSGLHGSQRPPVRRTNWGIPSICERAGITRARAAQAVRELEDAGLVKNVDQGGKGFKTRFEIHTDMARAGRPMLLAIDLIRINLGELHRRGDFDAIRQLLSLGE